MKKIHCMVLIVFVLPFFFCSNQTNGQPVKVALTKSSPNYIDWITRGDSSIILINLDNLKLAEAIQKLHECAGLVLTGGGDIDPSLYKNEDDNKVCRDIDQNRDKLEKAMINEALAMKMPILGICRGEQMLNVVLGGTLITDIPSYIRSKGQVNNLPPGKVNTGMETAVPLDPAVITKPGDVVHQCDDYLQCYHSVRLDASSYLHIIIGVDTGVVTSNHHQAVLKLGKGLKQDAQAADSIIEGIEWKDPGEKSFMVGVQWHPERMDFSNPFSGKLLQKFLAETKKYALISPILK
jgi:putative glutamine amidotransferase